MRFGVTIFSYDGEVTFGVTGDHDASPDVDVLARGIADGLADLVKIAEPGHVTQKAKAKARRVSEHDAAVQALLDRVVPAKRRRDAETMLALMARATRRATGRGSQHGGVRVVRLPLPERPRRYRGRGRFRSRARARWSCT